MRGAEARLLGPPGPRSGRGPGVPRGRSGAWKPGEREFKQGAVAVDPGMRADAQNASEGLSPSMCSVVLVEPKQPTETNQPKQTQRRTRRPSLLSSSFPRWNCAVQTTNRSRLLTLTHRDSPAAEQNRAPPSRSSKRRRHFGGGAEHRLFPPVKGAHTRVYVPCEMHQRRPDASPSALPLLPLAPVPLFSPFFFRSPRTPRFRSSPGTHRNDKIQAGILRR